MLALDFHETVALNKLRKQFSLAGADEHAVAAMVKAQGSVFDDDELSDDQANGMLDESDRQFETHVKANCPRIAKSALEVTQRTRDLLRAKLLAREKRRAAGAIQADRHRGSGLHPDTQDELQKGTTMDFSKVNKAGVMELMTYKAEQIQKAEPTFTHEQAFAKFMHTPEGADLYQIYKRAPAPSNVIPIERTIRKVRTDSAHAQLEAMGAEIRKSEPRLSQAQAYTRAFKSNPGLAQRAVREDPYEPLDAA